MRRSPDWLETLSQRERAALFLAVAVVAGFLIWLLAFRPLAQAQQRLAEREARLRPDVAWLEAAASEVARLRAADRAGPGKRGEQSLLALTEQSARAAGLGQAFRRGEPAGEKRVRVWLENASFDAMLTWLQGLQSRYGVAVIDGTVDGAGTPGLVNVRLLLAEP